MKRLLAAMSAAVLLAVFAPAAAAQDPLCGPVIFTDVTLDGDVFCDLRVMRSGVVVDLNGYTVHGLIAVGRHWEEPLLPDEEDQPADVTVRNGTARAVHVSMTGGLIHLEDLEASFRLRMATVAIDGVTGTVDSAGGSYSLRNGAIEAVLPFSGSYGVGNWHIESSAVGAMEVSDDDEVAVTGSEIGTVVAEHEAVLRLEENRVAGMVSIGSLVRATVLRNRFVGADAGFEGLYLGRSDLSVDIRENTFDGGHGLDLSLDGSSVHVEGNVFSSNTGDGLRIEDLAPPGSSRGRIASNLSFGNTGNGMAVTAAGRETALEVSGNHVVRNGGHGIFAPGAVDGGANVAVGNGEAPACVGVACSSK